MINRGRGDIRRLAAASAISGTGDWAASTALALAVYAKTGSAVWLSVSFLLTRLPSALVAPVFSLLFAFSDAFAFVGFNGIYQRRTPDAIRGRVFAVVGAVMTLATAVGFGFAGFLVDAVSWRPVYLGGGLVDVACAVALALSLRWAPWRRAEPGPVPRATGP